MRDSRHTIKFSTLYVTYIFLKGSESPPGGGQVDGSPPDSSTSSQWIVPGYELMVASGELTLVTNGGPLTAPMLARGVCSWKSGGQPFSWNDATRNKSAPRD